MRNRRARTPRPREPLNRLRVLDAAVAIADAKSIESLTMRELGLMLGVEAMSVYNHVANKDDILDGMVDRVVAEIALPSESVNWKEAMRRRAVSARKVFRRHPWAATLIDTRPTSGPARLRYLDWVIGTLRGAGFTLEMTLRAFSLIDSYIYGFARQQPAVAAGDDTTPQERAAAFLAQIPADEYPHLREVVVDHSTGAGQDEEADFVFGLNLILDGLERLLEKTRRP